LILEKWAKKWGLTNEAMLELQNLIGAKKNSEKEGKIICESDVQTAIRVAASEKGMRLWRNNVGATYTKEGRFLRYGLANDSKSVNEKIKSSDLIGIRPLKIRPEFVGATFGQFVAMEVKRGDWRYTGTKREVAQMRFLTLVASLGGDAKFTTGRL
jgi:hypothetical protein